MKHSEPRRSKPANIILTVAALLLAATLALYAGPKPAANVQVVDSGSFSVYVRGERVATEIFTIKQFADHNTTASELKLADGKTAQTAEMQLAANGDLRRYEWREVSPGKAVSVLEPQDQFLIQHVTGTDKPMEQPFLVPASTVVLDDYFFSHRELLAWRYLATSCQMAPGASGCPLPKAQFGVVVPRQRSTSTVNIEFVGREKINIRGKERELSKFNLTGDIGDWILWLDDEKKLIRIVIAADQTEVLRD